jgi:hypothetical protein
MDGMIRRDYTFRIYLVCSPSNKVYVGYTGKSLEERKANHESDSKTSNLPFHKAIRKYGTLMSWGILEDNIPSLEKAHELEKLYISEYESHKPNKGYNCTLGGDGCVPTNRTRNKIRKSIKALGTNPGKLKQKPIKVFRDNKLIGKFANQIECAKILNLKASDISRCLRGRRKTYKGYTFKD